MHLLSNTYADELGPWEAHLPAARFNMILPCSVLYLYVRFVYVYVQYRAHHRLLAFPQALWRRNCHVSNIERTLPDYVEDELDDYYHRSCSSRPVRGECFHSSVIDPRTNGAMRAGYLSSPELLSILNLVASTDLQLNPTIVAQFICFIAWVELKASRD